MTTEHLGQGSTLPPKTEGIWRLYSMAYCPYAQRARLVLKLKGVPHEIVNIDLKNKPDWYLKISPTGKVPLLDTGSDIITESVDICRFIDQKYPDPPLLGSDEKTNDEDKQLIESYNSLIVLFYQAVYKVSDKTLQQHLEEMKPRLAELEAELKKRGTFFGGNEPKLPDYMLWPWAERSPLLGIVYKEKLSLEDLQIPSLLNWVKEMKNQSIIKELCIDPSLHYKLALHVRDGNAFSYDNL